MKYQKFLTNDKLQCLICPRKCILSEGKTGFCHVRKNVNNNLVLDSYGYNTGLAIDPIEKKPLYHFYPSSKVLSFGTIGCNMGCKFCQNWQTTKSKISCKNTNPSSPEEIAGLALEHDCMSVAFTYNEPIIFFEYALDTAKYCHEHGIKTVAVTSGYVNPEPAKEFFSFIDAANIDLKGFSKRFYAKNCYADINPILDTIKYVVNQTNCHVELTTMLIDGENDSYEEIVAECNWILENLGDTIPLHFSAFFPNYKMNNIHATNFTTLVKAYNIARSMGIKYVYTGNLSNIETSSTYCKHCGNPIIVRNGYKLLQYNIINDSRCVFCGTQCDGFYN